MMTLEITDTDEYLPVQTVCDFATLVGTYSKGFSIIIEPFDERMPNIPDPVLQVLLGPSDLLVLLNTPSFSLNLSLTVYYYYSLAATMPHLQSSQCLIVSSLS